MVIQTNEEMEANVKEMSREEWEKIFDRWYRHVFKIDVVAAEGPSDEIMERCYGLGVSPAEAVNWLQQRGLEQG